MFSAMPLSEKGRCRRRRRMQRKRRREGEEEEEELAKSQSNSRGNNKLEEPDHWIETRRETKVQPMN